MMACFQLGDKLLKSASRRDAISGDLGEEATLACPTMSVSQEADVGVKWHVDFGSKRGCFFSHRLTAVPEYVVSWVA